MIIYYDDYLSNIKCKCGCGRQAKDITYKDAEYYATKKCMDKVII